MEVIGFVFGMSGLTFGLMGMILGSAASTKVAELEKRLQDAGIIPPNLDE